MILLTEHPLLSFGSHSHTLTVAHPRRDSSGRYTCVLACWPTGAILTGFKNPKPLQNLHLCGTREEKSRQHDKQSLGIRHKFSFLFILIDLFLIFNRNAALRIGVRVSPISPIVSNMLAASNQMAVATPKRKSNEERAPTPPPYNPTEEELIMHLAMLRLSIEDDSEAISPFPSPELSTNRGHNVPTANGKEQQEGSKNGEEKIKSRYVKESHGIN